MMVAGLMSENIEINAMSAYGCPSVQSSQSSTATTRGYVQKELRGIENAIYIPVFQESDNLMHIPQLGERPHFLLCNLHEQ